MAKDKSENKVVQLQTKVSAESYARLKAISQKHGFTIYDLLQMLAECIIRYMDTATNLSDDLVRIIRMFEDIRGWRDAFRLTEPFEKTEIEVGHTGDGHGGIKVVEREKIIWTTEIMEAFYVLRHPENGTGCRIAHVTRSDFDRIDGDGWQVDYNVQTQIERFIEVEHPTLYRHLREVGNELKTESILDTLQRLADMSKESKLEVELRKEFEEYGGKDLDQLLEEARNRKRPYTPSEEHLQKTLFDDNQNEE